MKYFLSSNVVAPAPDLRQAFEIEISAGRHTNRLVCPFDRHHAKRPIESAPAGSNTMPRVQHLTMVLQNAIFMKVDDVCGSIFRSNVRMPILATAARLQRLLMGRRQPDVYRCGKTLCPLVLRRYSGTAFRNSSAFRQRVRRRQQAG
jgi:hypothetical protein